jgi:UDP-glucose 4-epimerase
VNLRGTMNVLLAAQKTGVRRVVFASSAAVYGDDPELPKREDMRPTPIAPYGIEKLASEHYLSVWNTLFGVETVALRYFNVFGPRQDPSSAYSGVISVFVRRAIDGAPITVFGDGQQYRDFVNVADVVAINLLAASTRSAAGRVYNVGRGEKTTLNQLLSIIGKQVPKAPSVTHGEPRAGDIRESVADITRAKMELGYVPKVSVQAGLAELIAAVGDRA